MDIRSCVRFYDEDDLYKLTLNHQITADFLMRLASYEIDSFKVCNMNDLLEYVDGNGFTIIYDDSIKRYIVRRGKIK